MWSSLKAVWTVSMRPSAPSCTSFRTYNALGSKYLLYAVIKRTLFDAASFDYLFRLLHRSGERLFAEDVLPKLRGLHAEIEVRPLAVWQRTRRKSPDSKGILRNL